MINAKENSYIENEYIYRENSFLSFTSFLENYKTGNRA